jgi:hypothetical protein
VCIKPQIEQLKAWCTFYIEPRWKACYCSFISHSMYVYKFLDEVATLIQFITLWSLVCFTKIMYYFFKNIKEIFGCMSYLGASGIWLHSVISKQPIILHTLEEEDLC